MCRCIAVPHSAVILLYHQQYCTAATLCCSSTRLLYHTVPCLCLLYCATVLRTVLYWIVQSTAVPHCIMPLYYSSAVLKLCCSTVLFYLRAVPLHCCACAVIYWRCTCCSSGQGRPGGYWRNRPTVRALKKKCCQDSFLESIFGGESPADFCFR